MLVHGVLRSQKKLRGQQQKSRGDSAVRAKKSRRRK